MAENKCTVISGMFCDSKRVNLTDAIIVKNSDEVEITLCENDSFENFELNLNSIAGNSCTLYNFKKHAMSIFISIISVLVIMFALISSSIYEDVFKKVILDSPLKWEQSDSISMLFVLLFFFGMVMVPSILDGESSQFKDIIKSWFNKDTRILKRLRLSINELDKKNIINIYNIDLLNETHWVWKLFIPLAVKRFHNINFFIRNDQKQVLLKRLYTLNVLDVKSIKKECINQNFSNVEIFLSNKETTLYKLLQLSSTKIFKNEVTNKFVSLELFEYCGRNFFDNKSDKSQLISDFQSFINRSFDDFKFLKQHKSAQIYFTNNVNYLSLEDEQRRLAYYLRNHIEECLEYFDNPISLLVLYYYVKDIVLDDKRTVSILEQFILSVKNKQQYDLINSFWFKIAGNMFDSSVLESFEYTNDSMYRKLSISALNDLIFLFERNGHFEQALLLAKYLYEINPQKYSITISSLLERSGKFDEAYDALPTSISALNAYKPTELEIRFIQRKAWLIVSQRRDDKKEEGMNLLEEMSNLLFSHNEDNEPLFLWHYYNIKANYNEWNNELDNAIENYKNCLAIPSLGAFEYGATFVNMAIAYRLKFIQSDLKDFILINESISKGSIGVLLKNSVGDRDEMPVVLHNQALNILCKVVAEDGLDIKSINNVKILTNTGLEILDKTDSSKRLGILLLENYISNVLIEDNNKTNEVFNRLKLHWKDMNEHEKKQALEIYNMFIKYKGFALLPAM